MGFSYDLYGFTHELARRHFLTNTGGLRGALWAGALRFRGAPHNFWASRLFMAPCSSGLHCTILGRHIYVAGRWGTALSTL